MRCYLINLDRSSDRLEWFLKSTSDLDLDVVRIPAIDGNLLPDTETAAWLRYQSGHYDLVATEVGCFLSHRAVWGAVAGGENAWAFVAEDDIHFAVSASRFFSNPRWLPADADIVKAETFCNRVEVSGWPHSRVDGHSLRVLRSHHGGSAGYFVSRPAAHKLVELTERVCDLADEVLFDPRLGVADKFRIYQIDPAICVQDFFLREDQDRVGLGSTLDADRLANPKNDALRRKLRGFAKLKREASRPAIQLYRLMRFFAKRSVFKHIPFGEVAPSA